MRVGFVTARAVRATAHGLACDPGLGRLVDAVAARASSLALGAPVFTTPSEVHDHHLAVGARDFVPFPELWTFKEGVRLHLPVQLAIRQIEARSDVVIVQLPFATPTALLGARTPRVYQVCGDSLSLVRGSPRYRGRERITALLAAHAVDQLYQRLCTREDAVMIAHGRAILERYGPTNGEAVVSSTLYAREIASVPRARPADGRFRVVHVGHLRADKGMDVLIDAVQQARASVPELELHVIGPPVDADVADRLAGLAREGVLQLRGHRAFGPALFQELADADLLALPSFGDGTPRVLIEARAFGCPVVASAVGGIPTSVTHEADGLLVPPRDAAALAAAIVRIARDDALRARLVDNGYARARGTTVEALADRLVAAACQIVRRAS